MILESVASRRQQQAEPLEEFDDDSVHSVLNKHEIFKKLVANDVWAKLNKCGYIETKTLVGLYLPTNRCNRVHHNDVILSKVEDSFRIIISRGKEYNHITFDHGDQYTNKLFVLWGEDEFLNDEKHVYIFYFKMHSAKKKRKMTSKWNRSLCDFDIILLKLHDCLAQVE